MTRTRFTNAIGIAALTLVLATAALVAVTFEQRRRLGQPTRLGEHIETLIDSWTVMIWPPLMLASAAFFVVMWIHGDPERPIKMMRRELEAVTSSNLDRRVTPLTTGDALERFASTLNDTLDQLENAVLANERLVADAAHELRTPLTAVRAALEVQHIKSPGELLEDAIGEIDRAGKLIDDLLLLARSPSTGSRLELVDLDDVVMKEVSRLMRQHPAVSVSQSVKPVQQRLAHQDVASLARNLLENAAKYGGGEVKLSLDTHDGYSRLTVEDNGPGIASDQRSAVFDRFSRLDHSRDRATGGSGLGLAIVHETAQAHDGEVEIGDSALGGCRITVRIPLTEQAARPQGNAAIKPVASDTGTTVGRRALVLLSGACVVATLIGTGYLLRPNASRALESAGTGLIDRADWSVSASSVGDADSAQKAIDGDIDTRWTTGTVQGDPDMWFEIDLGSDMTVSRIELRLNEFSARDFPRGYRVEVFSEDSSEPIVVAVDPGVVDTFPVTAIEIEPQVVRRIRINQTGVSETQWWSIAELNVYR